MEPAAAQGLDGRRVRRRRRRIDLRRSARCRSTSPSASPPAACGSPTTAARTGAARPTGCMPTTIRRTAATAPEVQDIHRLVQCPAAPDTMWVQHHNGVFRSTDARAVVAGGHDDPPGEVRLRGGGASARSGHGVVRARREGRVPRAGRRQAGGGTHARRRALVRCADRGPAAEPRLRPGLSPRARRGRQRHAPGHGFDDRASVGVGERRRCWSLVAGHLPPISCVRFA